MFSYYGAKTKIIQHYPKPKHNKIIEPFAGSARYSLMYWDNEIILYETFEKVYRIWKYLIQATKNDILSLPDLKLGDDLRDFKQLSLEEKWLIGYQLGRGAARPSNIVNERCRWNKDKIRIANDVYKVKHWVVHNNSGLEHDWNNATYFVDPPYQKQSHGYSHKYVDYNLIIKKIEEGNSFFIVCGNESDRWLDFKPLIKMRGTNKEHIEMIFIKGE